MSKLTFSYYNQLRKPVRTYGIELWGCTRPKNLCQNTKPNRELRDIVNTPWYSRNDAIGRELKIETVEAEIKCSARKHDVRLHHHINVKATQLLKNSNLRRRLRRKKNVVL